MPREREPGKPLGNARHERFAQGVASGMSATGAYEDAGYEPDRGHASRLARISGYSQSNTQGKTLSIIGSHASLLAERFLGTKP